MFLKQATSDYILQLHYNRRFRKERFMSHCLDFTTTNLFLIIDKGKVLNKQVHLPQEVK